jgi:DNA primase
MPTVPAALLSEIKAAAPLSRVLESRGVELRPRGGDLVCRCPLPEHDDGTPSFHVTANDAGGGGHCFGCDWAGNAIQLVQALDGCGFVDAVASLAQLGGVAFEADRYRPPVRRVAAGGPACPLDPAATGHELDAQVLRFAQAELQQRESPGRAYLVERGAWSDAAAARFRLGFLPAGKLGRLLNEHRLHARTAAGKELRAALMAQGWLSERSGHATMDGRIVVPVFGADGALLQCYGRAVSRLAHGSPSHRHLGRPIAGCWNADGLVDGNGRAVITEAAIDALSLWVHRVQAVTFTLGAGQVTDEHVTALQAGGARDVVIAYDADEAGEAGAQRVADRLIGAGLTVYRALPPAGQDVNDVVRAAGADVPEALAALMRSAQWLGGTPRVAVPAGLPSPAADAVAQASPVAGPSPASLLSAAVADVAVAEPDGALEATIGNRVYRLRGLEACTGPELLRVVLRVQVGDAFHQDRLDLCQHRQRSAFVAAASDEVPVQPAILKQDLGKLLLIAEQRVLDRAQRAEERRQADAAGPALNPRERREALGLLRDADLLDRIVADLGAAGLVGEATNKLLCYIAAVSRLLPVESGRPLGVVVQSSSGSGKSALVDAVLGFVPEEARLELTSLSPEALNFFPPGFLRHKTLSIAEDEGMGEAAYYLKLLQSEGRLVRARPAKDAQTGELETVVTTTEGPTQLFITTTRDDIDPELVNRCLVLTVDEAEAQTAAIQAAQRQARTPRGFAAARSASALRALHRNAQRLLRPVVVLNPYAEQLRFPAHRSRLRRDQAKYLALCETIALLCQHQRPWWRLEGEAGSAALPCILVERRDIAAANRLAHAVLGRSLDELPPQPRKLLDAWQAWARQEATARDSDPCELRITRRELQQTTGWSYAQVRRHLSELEAQEYVAVHGGKARNLSTYQLLEAGDDQPAAPAERRLPGLVEADDLVEPDPAWLAALRPASGPDDCSFDASLTPRSASLTPQDRQFDPNLTPEGGQTEIGKDSKESGDSDHGNGQFASLTGETHPPVSVHASKSYRYSVNGTARAAEAGA